MAVLIADQNRNVLYIEAAAVAVRLVDGEVRELQPINDCSTVPFDCLVDDIGECDSFHRRIARTNGDECLIRIHWADIAGMGVWQIGRPSRSGTCLPEMELRIFLAVQLAAAEPQYVRRKSDARERRVDREPRPIAVKRIHWPIYL